MAQAAYKSGGFPLGSNITLTGKVKTGGGKFIVELKYNNTEIPVRMVADFSTKTVTFESELSGKSKEKGSLPTFPFATGRAFTLVIKPTSAKYLYVKANEQEATVDFENVELQNIIWLEVNGDVKVDTVSNEYIFKN